MPSTKLISGPDDSSASWKAAEQCTTPAKRCAPVHGARRSSFTVRALARPAGPKRRRKSTRAHTFAFSVPRRLQLALLDCPEVRCELARRRRVFLTELAVDITLAGFSLNAAAHILGVSPGRLCTWLQRYRRSGPAGLRSQSQTALSNRQAPCRFSFFLAL